MAGNDDIRQRLEQVASGGWDGLGSPEAVLEEAQRAHAALETARQRREREMVHAALTTPAGQALLAWLKAHTIERRPDGDELAATVEAYALAKARRDGQNAVVFWLLELLAEQDKEEVTP